MWDEITYSFPNANGCTIKVWEWINNFILYFIMDVINNPCLHHILHTYDRCWICVHRYHSSTAFPLGSRAWARLPCLLGNKGKTLRCEREGKQKEGLKATATATRHADCTPSLLTGTTMEHTLPQHHRKKNKIMMKCFPNNYVWDIYFVVKIILHYKAMV